MQFKSSNIEVDVDPITGTLMAMHLNDHQGDYWQENSLSPEFRDALAERRLAQAKAIYHRLREQLAGAGKILDYGCGYGVWVNELLENGLDAYGTDLSVANHLPKDRFIKASGPWSVPDHLSEFGMVSLFDVIEHIHDVEAFLCLVRDAKVPQLLIKVPLREGPIMQGAELLARFGRPSLLEQLFLVGDVSPHVHYFTKKGLIDLLSNCGYDLQVAFTLPEVGRELARRKRSASNVLSKVLLPMVGLTLDCVARCGWSDTGVFLFRHK